MNVEPNQTQPISFVKDFNLVKKMKFNPDFLKPL